MPKFMLSLLFVKFFFCRKFCGHVNLKKSERTTFFSSKLKVVFNMKTIISEVFFLHETKFIEMLSFSGALSMSTFCVVCVYR